MEITTTDNEQTPQKSFRATTTSFIKKFRYTSSSSSSNASMNRLVTAAGSITPHTSLFKKQIESTNAAGASTGANLEKYVIASGTTNVNAVVASSTLKKSTSAAAFHLFPISNTTTTTPDRSSCKSLTKFSKIINPFEQHLAERLHLPLICSPSLFQRPVTPQHCSTQFEWTIDEVSSLGPANVEAHETQFYDALDPDVEAKAQAAISSYFKDNVIVPSPIDCSLRNHRLNLLSENNMNSSQLLKQKPIKRIRDGIAQTILTLPPILPAEIEIALRPYMKFNVEQQQSPVIKIDESNNKSSNEINHEARDTSLRRKLFELPFNYDEETVDGVPEDVSSQFSPPPKTPEMEIQNISPRKTGDSAELSKNSFGCLSPITKENYAFTPNGEIPFLESSGIEITIENKNHHSNNDSKKTVSICSNLSLFRSTPDSSPCQNSINYKNSSKNAYTMSIINDCQTPGKKDLTIDNSFNVRISRLMVNKDKKKSQNLKKSKSEDDLFNISSQNLYEDEMQVSEYSIRSNNSSISSTPPSGKRRSTASRKNLSQSFSVYSDEDISENNEKPKVKRQSLITNKKNFDINTSLMTKEKPNSSEKIDTNNLNFFRTDSGFNEAENTQDDSKFVVNAYKNKLKCYSSDVSMSEDISMSCPSAPSNNFKCYET